MVVMVNFHHTGHLQILENNDSEVEMQDAASEGGIFKSHFFPVLYKFFFFFFRLSFLIYHGSLKNSLNILESLICKEANPLFIFPATDLRFLSL